MDEQVKQGVIYAMRLFSISKKSESQIREKLDDKGYSEESIDRVVKELKTQGILDDLSYAKEKVYWALHGSPIGKRRIKFELKRKGVGEHDITEALNDLDPEDEKRRAFEFATQKAETFKSLEPLKRKKKLYDHLMRRGFDYEVIKEVVQMVTKNAENDRD